MSEFDGSHGDKADDMHDHPHTFLAAVVAVLVLVVILLPSVGSVLAGLYGQGE